MEFKLKAMRFRNISFLILQRAFVQEYCITVLTN
jgi:hypothetical protein